MIKTQNLTKRFDGETALAGVDCLIPQGCIYGLVGSNGAGKSTFLRLLSGIYRPDEGTVTIDSLPVYDNPAVKGRMAFVPDDLYFLPGADLRRMMKLYEAAYPAFDKAYCFRLIETLRLNPCKAIHTFSKGMRRQASLLLALSCRPDYLFFDETFDGLDPVVRRLVKSLICQEVSERQVTAIIASHSLRELEDTCDQLALLHEGGIVLESDVSDLKTSLFKVQIALPEPYDRTVFEGIELLEYNRLGSVSRLIIRGGRDETVQRLQALSPLVLDVLPLTLEEVFTHEMSALGYCFDTSLLGGGTTEAAEVSGL